MRLVVRMSTMKALSCFAQNDLKYGALSDSHLKTSQKSTLRNVVANRVSIAKSVQDKQPKNRHNPPSNLASSRHPCHRAPSYQSLQTDRRTSNDHKAMHMVVRAADWLRFAIFASDQ
jgi:hypothetical protein